MNLTGGFFRPQAHYPNLEFGDRVAQCVDAFAPGKVRYLHAAAQAQAFGAVFVADGGTTRNGATGAIQYQCAAGVLSVSIKK